MNTTRTLAALSCILLPAALSSRADAQDAHAHPAAATTAKPDAPAAQMAFKQLKSLAGTWKGAASTDPVIPQMSGDSMNVTLRVTSLGNAIMHNMTSPRRPDDPITMMYLETDRLLLTHYCDAGNRPRMEAAISPDGKTVTFQFIDLVGPTKYGHMNRAVFTIIDDNHHIEEWTYVLPDKSTVRARFDLKRTGAAATKSSAE